MMLKARFLFLFLLVFFSFQGKAQISFDSPEELEKAANEFFDANDFAKAKPLFSQLLSKDALDPNFNYRFGVCILFTEADPLKPLPYIEGGANSPGVNSEAYYFLGKAYQLNYRFNDAITSYQKAKSAGLNKPNIDLERSIEECRNGKILYNPAIDFEPAQDKEVIASEFYRPYDFRKLKGKVIPMPPNFKTKYDEKNLTGTVVYTPSNSQTLVYASYGEDGANAKDLYRVNRLPNGELALPQRLPNTINTKYDEDYAFYDEEAQILFFASKGHNTMGGYDVFSSKFDANKGTWSTPLNLQYPVNSPFDDFLYVSDPEGKVAFFTSERNVDAGKLRVMKTLLHDPLQVEVSVLEGTYTDKTDSVYNYAAITVLDPITNEVVGKYRSHKETGKYLLILPPQNDYTMNVGPREADGFKFDLDVPKHESVKPLQQAIAYETENDKGIVTVTNYFDATGNPDSVAFEASRLLTEIEKQMVEMPDASEILAAKQLKKQQAEQAQKDALALQKAKQDSIKQAEELALKEQKAAEEAIKQAELAKAEKLRTDSIRHAEEVALALQQKEAEKAKTDSINQAEQLALEAQKAAEEAIKQAELTKAEKLRTDSIRHAEEVALALQQKEAEKAKKDSINQAEQLALEAQKAAEEAIRQAQLAKVEKLRIDSIRQAEEVALALQQEELAAKSEQARTDSLQKVEELALQQSKAAEAAKLAEFAEAEKAALDAMLEAEKNAALALREKEVEEAKQDSLKQIETLALQAQEVEKQQTESTTERNLVAEALEKARQDSIQDVAEFNKLRAKHLAQRAKRDSINKAIELAKLKEEREKFMKDSIAAMEVAIAQEKETKLELLNDRKDILTQIKEIELKAQLVEKERLAAIDREVEMAKQKAMSDSLIEPEIGTSAEIAKADASSEDILKEMAEKEAEILNRSETEKKPSENELILEAKSDLAQPKELALADTTKNLIETTEVVQTKEVIEATREVASKTTELTETKAISESELFLQTIAKLEAQKKEQESLVKEENDQRKNAQAEKAIAKAEAQRLADTTGTVTASELTSDNRFVSDEIATADIDTTKIETASVALKSDANPEEYLAALNKIEKEIAKEAEVNKDKTYELKELNPEPKNSRTVEPLLQAKIDADRQALAEHQKIAVEKERALKEQMQRDKTTVTQIDKAAEEELATIEDEISNELDQLEVKTNKPVLAATKEKAEAVSTESSTPEPVAITEELEQVDDEISTETVVSEQIVSEEPTVSKEDQEVLNAMAEFDKILDGAEEAESTNEIKTVEDYQEAEEKETPLAAIDTEEKTEEIEEAQPSANENAVAKEIVSETLQPAQTTTKTQPSIVSDSDVGIIPFMTAALRDYGKRKPSFDKIEDPSMRRMVKRMRSEDVGRIAVLKNMKNEWVDAGKTTESLKDIKDNLRNQDVLETVASAPSSREEFIRPPFDKNTLRKRQDVHYKIAFKISTAGVSETISEAMSPEQAISFAMPEFELQSGYYQTLADVNSDLKEYKGRGFESLKIVTYLKNEPVRLSDVTDIPFID